MAVIHRCVRGELININKIHLQIVKKKHFLAQVGMWEGGDFDFNAHFIYNKHRVFK